LPTTSQEMHASPSRLWWPAPQGSHAVFAMFGCVPAAQWIGQVPSVPANPAGHASHATRSALGCVPAAQSVQTPSGPCWPAGHGMQLVLAPLCVVPGPHALQKPSVPAVPSAQTSQPLWSASGSYPASQGTHAAPSLLYDPAGHVSHPSDASFGCWPGEHVEHDCMSSNPLVSSLCRWVPFTHVMQCVAPTSNMIVSGSCPGGQYWQSKPTDEILPGGHTSQTVLSAFGDRSAGQAPLADIQPRLLLKIDVFVHDTQQSATTARGSFARGHWVHMPCCPAWTAGYGPQADRPLFGMNPCTRDTSDVI